MCGKLLVTNKLTALVTHRSVFAFFSYSLNELLVGNSYFSFSEAFSSEFHHKRHLSCQNLHGDTHTTLPCFLPAHLIEKVPLNAWLLLWFVAVDSRVYCYWGC